MGWIEYLPPDQDLRNDIIEITKIGNGEEPEAGMAKKAMGMRDVIEKWGKKVHAALFEKMNEFVDLATPPSVEGQEPVFPNEAAFDFSKIEQVKEFIRKAKAAWHALNEFHRNRDLYKTRQIPSHDPADRFMLMTQKLKTIIGGLEAMQFRAMEVMGVKYTIGDAGLWPGHKIAKALSPAADKYFRDLSAPKAPISMARWLYHVEIPGEKKESAKPETKTEPKANPPGGSPAKTGNKPTEKTGNKPGTKGKK
jgi:hypothetical protein